MQTVGPFNATSNPALVAGTAFPVSMDSASVSLQIHNDSPYRLYVQFDGARPTIQYASQGVYQAVAGPWSHPVVMIPRGNGQQFLGTIWIMPVDISSTLASAGTISSVAEVHIDAFLAGEDTPQSWAMPRQLDSSSQQRVIAIPPAGGQLLNGTWNTATFATQGIALFALSATNIALQAAQLYLFHLGMYQQLPGAAAAPAQTRAAVQAQFQTSGFVNVGSPVSMYIFPFINYLTATQFATTNIVLTPFFPICSTLTVPATAAWLAVNLVKVGGADTQIQFDYQMWLDPNNAGPPASYGGNAGPQRWSGQYSQVAGLW